MNIKKMRRMAGLALLLLAGNLRTAQGAPGFDDSGLAESLGRHVHAGRVDYAALKSQRQGLDRFLEAAGDLPAAEFERWSSAEKMSFLINLYNAATIRLVLDHYPVASIKAIGPVLSTP